MLTEILNRPLKIQSTYLGAISSFPVEQNKTKRKIEYKLLQLKNLLSLNRFADFHSFFSF